MIQIIYKISKVGLMNQAPTQRWGHKDGVRSCFLLYSYKRYFLLMHYSAYDPSLFINGKRSVAESHTKDRKYPCRFDACNEILKRLYEIFDTDKKQKTRPDPTMQIKSIDYKFR
jgi:hypothetical protein